MHMCSFYRPPKSGDSPLVELDKVFQQLTASADPPIVIAGDFNCGDIDWEHGIVQAGASEPIAQQRLIDMMDDNSLIMIITL